METDFNTLIEEKVKNLYEFVESVIPPHKKDRLENITAQPLSAKLLFIMFLQKDKIESHVEDFCNEFSISFEYKPKITEYIEFFVDVKYELMNRFSTELANRPGV